MFKSLAFSARNRTFLFFLFSLAFTCLHAQDLKLRIRVNQVPKIHSSDSVFIAGNFNGWNPHSNSLENTADNNKELILSLPTGNYEFKFTRGNWSKGEVNSSGKHISNRTLKLSADTTIEASIEGWADDFETVETRSANVSIIDTAFNIPQLSRKRRIWVYLPKNYQRSNKRYPVLYMHDGQNLFDRKTSGYGEWGVDEALDSISEKSEVGIIVGIDNGLQRINEYNAFTNEEYGRGEGKQYIDFIVQTLKPYIDKKFRTLPGREHTAIAGSSLGGLISYYAAITRPEVFGKAGIFSPSFWIAPEMKNYTDSLGGKLHSKIFFYMGAAEGDKHVKNMEEIADILGARSSSLIYSAVDPDGKHNEVYWGKWFPEFYRWIMSDWTNYIIR